MEGLWPLPVYQEYVHRTLEPEEVRQVEQLGRVRGGLVRGEEGRGGRGGTYSEQQGKRKEYLKDQKLCAKWKSIEEDHLRLEQGTGSSWRERWPQ